MSNCRHSSKDSSTMNNYFGGPGMPSVGQLLFENERVTRKLRKVQQRRDYYAKLYHDTLSELDNTKWQLASAMNTIKELRSSQGHILKQQRSHSNTTSPDSGASLSPGINSMTNQRSSDAISQHEREVHEREVKRTTWDHENVKKTESMSNLYSQHQPKRGQRPPHLHIPVDYAPHQARTNYHHPMDHHIQPFEAHHNQYQPIESHHVNQQQPGEGHYHYHPNQHHQDHRERRPSQDFHPQQGVPHPLGDYSHHYPSYAKDHSPQQHITAHTPHHPIAERHPLQPHPLETRPPQNRRQSAGDYQTAHYHSASAFSPNRAGFVRSYSLSTDLSPQLQRSPLQRCPPITPLTATPLTVPDYPSFVQQSKKSFQRSMTLPYHQHQPQFSPAKPLDKTQLSHSHDDLLSSNVTERRSAFKKPMETHYLPQHKYAPEEQRHCTSSSSEGSSSRLSVTTSSSTTVLTTANHIHHTYDALSDVDLLNLVSKIASPDCHIQSLEIKRSNLGRVETMKLLCNDLVRNTSIQELSLPENGIGADSLSVLLETLKSCANIKELKLRKNLIDQDCANLIKGFLAVTRIDSLVLTGNQIEQYGHLLNGQVPNEFSVEYSTDGSEDSGVHTSVATPSNNEPSPQISSSFKYLRI